MMGTMNANIIARDYAQDAVVITNMEAVCHGQSGDRSSSVIV